MLVTVAGIEIWVNAVSIESNSKKASLPIPVTVSPLKVEGMVTVLFLNAVTRLR